MVIKDDENRGQFSMIPFAVRDDKRLKPVDIYIMSYLLGNKEDWPVFQKRVAQKCRISLAVVKASFKRLTDAGYAVYQQKREASGEWGKGDWVIYEVSQKTIDGENRQVAKVEEESGWTF